MGFRRVAPAHPERTPPTVLKDGRRRLLKRPYLVIYPPNMRALTWLPVDQLTLAEALGTFRVTFPSSTARAEIVRLRSEGMSAARIARRFNTQAVPTPTGRGQWWPSTVIRHADPAPWRDYMARYRTHHPRLS